MITTYVIDAVLLLALVLTSLRVVAMHRELKRLRGYQSEYVEVFGETSRAVDNIDAALRHLGGEGREVLERLEASIGKAKMLSKRLEDMARAAERPKREAEQTDDIGTYSRKVVQVGDTGAESAASKNEILRFTGDSRPPQERLADAVGRARFSVPHHSGREFRMAPSVKTVRAAGGNG